jgi:hypothetical protein
MKIFKIITQFVTIVALSSLYLSCSKENPLTATTNSELSNSATAQVFNATVRASRNYVYVDGKPVSGAAFAFGGVFPATAYAFKLDAGARSLLIKDTLPTTTQAPLSFSQTLDVGKNYTIFTYDTVTSPKQITVINNIVIPTDTSSMLRFANFIYNTATLPNVDVYSFRKISGTPVFVGGVPVFSTSTPVFSNIATTQVTDFIPYPSGLSDTLYVFATGTTSPLIAKQLVSALVPTRSYTSVYNGSFKGVKGVTTFATY